MAVYWLTIAFGLMVVLAALGGEHHTALRACGRGLLHYCFRPAGGRWVTSPRD